MNDTSPKRCPFCFKPAEMVQQGCYGCSDRECPAYLANIVLRLWNRRPNPEMRPAEDGLAREPVAYRYKANEGKWGYSTEHVITDSEPLFRSPPLEPFERLVEEMRNYQPAQTDIAVVETYREGVGRGLAIAADKLTELLKSARGTKT